jgi:hypothetical protein
MGMVGTLERLVLFFSFGFDCSDVSVAQACSSSSLLFTTAGIVFLWRGLLNH